MRPDILLFAGFLLLGFALVAILSFAAGYWCGLEKGKKEHESSA